MVETDDYPSPRVIAFRRRMIIRLPVSLPSRDG